MKSCKQLSWSPFSEEESMISKDEESSSCSLLHNLMGNCNMMQEEECSMCGDVGLPQYLFKCLTCSHRYQHIYCSKFYPYRMEATICNWCLPMEQLVNNIAQIDDNKDNMKVSNSIMYYTNRNTKPDIEATSNSLVDSQKHTKAFECLLQVAELHDQGHQLDNLECAATEGDNCIIGQFSEKKYVGHDQINGICSFYEVGPGQMNAKELNNQEPANLMMHQIIFGGCSNRSFYTRRAGDKIDHMRGPSATSTTQLRYNHSQLHAYMGHDQIGQNLTNQGVGHCQSIKKLINYSQDLGHDHLMQKLDNQDLAQNQTIKKLNHQDQSHDLQVPSISPVKEHQIGCSDGNEQTLKWPDAAAVSKRARLHKQLHGGAAGGDNRNTAVDQQKTHSQAANYNVCSDDSDDQQVGKSCFSWQGAGDSTGPAKRPWHRHAVQIIAGDIDVVNPAAGQRAIAGNNDLGNTATNDQQRVMSNNKQSSPTQHAWSRPAGKRDHLMNSPSRAINRRYKLLADVLC